MIVIDADGCPVVNLTLDIAQRFGVKCCVVADTSHSFDFGDKAEIITVSKGADSADFRIVNLIKKRRYCHNSGLRTCGYVPCKNRLRIKPKRLDLFAE